MKLEEIISKTSMANIVAAVIIIVAIVYAVLTENDELVRNISLFGLGYLFGSAGMKK